MPLADPKLRNSSRSEGANLTKAGGSIGTLITTRNLRHRTWDKACEYFRHGNDWKTHTRETAVMSAESVPREDLYQGRESLTRGPAAAGWYSDPHMTRTLRYWNGQVWTDHRQAIIASAPQPQISVAAGYWFAFLIPIIGFILGITYLSKKPSDGVAVMVLSVVAFTIYSTILSALSGS
jgi:hypothetical protein